MAADKIDKTKMTDLPKATVANTTDPGAKVIGRWPEGAIVYQIYPRSLQDSDGDGIGDLPGITGRLEYIKSLGVNAIWLSPFYPSPMADFGYDISDYCDVNPLFGTLDDFKALMAAAERLELKVMVDLVPNHSSDEHPWFKQSCRSRTNRYANWYVWRDAKNHDHVADGATPLPPNNWRDALTGGPAWQWVESRQQFYLHGFDVKQPDLNWTNSLVREAIKEAMRFWLRLGVDGFRVDAVYWMAKDPLFRDDSPNPEYVEGQDPPYESLLHDNSRGWPAVYAYLAEMDQVLKEKEFQAKPRFMVTEAYPEGHNPVAAYLEFYAGVDPLVAAPFNFEGITMGWDVQGWRRFLRNFHTALRDLSPLCVPSYAFGNHDQPRLASRFGEPAARSAAVLLLTLPGMVFIYNGEEIGLRNVDIPPEMVQDPAAKNDPANAEKRMGRDPSRTPMQWTAGHQAGFTDGDSTWLPLAPDYKQRNVESQSIDAGSFLSLYRQLGGLRNRSDAIKHGELGVIESGAPQVLAYVRSYGDERYLVLVNFGEEAAGCQPELAAGIEECVLSSVPRSRLLTGKNFATVALLPHEAAVFALS